MPTPDEDPMQILKCLKESRNPLTLRSLYRVTGLNLHALGRILSRLVAVGSVSQVTKVDRFGFGVVQYRLRNSSEEMFVQEHADSEEEPLSNQLIENSSRASSMHLVNKRSKLSPDEEYRLIQKVREENDRKSESSLLLNRLIWLSGIAHSMCNEPDKILELVQVGAEAFLKSIRRFDKDKGRNLIGYAYRRVRGSMLNFLAQEDRLVRVSETKRLINRLIQVTSERFRVQHGREPLIQEIAEETELTEDTIRSAALAELTQSIGELDPMSEGLFADNDLQQPEQIVETRHFLERLTRIISDNANFTEREKKILYLRYLVPAAERKKLRELAADMKISTSRVHRIEKRAIVKLKKQLIEEEWLNDGEIELE